MLLHYRPVVLRNSDLGQNGGAAFYAVSGFYAEFGRSRKDHVSTRTKFNQSNALAARKRIPHFFSEDNAPRQQSGNLLEDHSLPFALDGHDVLFVGIRRGCAHGIGKLSAPVNNLPDHTGNRRAVYMNIKNVEKDAD